jgi:hypothetical protein
MTESYFGVRQLGNGGLDLFLAERPERGPGTGVPHSRMVLGESFEL